MIDEGNALHHMPHPNQQQYPHQYVFVVEIN
jgi:hypothetical protein